MSGEGRDENEGFVWQTKVTGRVNLVRFDIQVVRLEVYDLQKGERSDPLTSVEVVVHAND